MKSVARTFDVGDPRDRVAAAFHSRDDSAGIVMGAAGAAHLDKVNCNDCAKRAKNVKENSANCPNSQVSAAIVAAKTWPEIASNGKN
jgi:hypothetical protein